ncbi:hypothetical protein PIB30_020905 [Stylosanthes scabra]|uniref:Uncharacterized protein n=1 Tax=Stylosanthes scabra TaxID=79078 RepID=A0ABU6Y6X0_9FABA|nr:hypothetical protein [Stylosanthes scabra]
MSNIIAPKMMRNTRNASLASEISIWRSPIPYLFGGMALLFVLISVALVILICSHIKHTSSEGEEEMKETIMARKVAVHNNEPKILVIMAGDEIPSYLAEPIASLNHCTCEANPTTPSSSSINVEMLTN